jgi:hypothetical protein
VISHLIDPQQPPTRIRNAILKLPGISKIAVTNVAASFSPTKPQVVSRDVFILEIREDYDRKIGFKEGAADVSK